MSTATIHDLAISSLDDLRIALDQPPKVSPSLGPLIAWIIQLFKFVAYAFDISFKRIDRIFADRETITHPPPTISLHAATAGSTTIKATSATPGKRARCTSCHARGHTASDCRTTNPGAMRKRVARNSRLAKEARANTAAASTSVAPPSPYPPTFPFPPYLAPPTHMAYSALVADSTELRRRATQSARDKRRRQRPPAPS